MNLVIAEKPSVAQSIAAVLGANDRQDGYITGNGYAVSWCVGHLAELASAEAYDEKYAKWKAEDLPILPQERSCVDIKSFRKSGFPYTHGKIVFRQTAMILMPDA